MTRKKARRVSSAMDANMGSTWVMRGWFRGWCSLAYRTDGLWGLAISGHENIAWPRLPTTEIERTPRDCSPLDPRSDNRVRRLGGHVADRHQRRHPARLVVSAGPDGLRGLHGPLASTCDGRTWDALCRHCRGRLRYPACVGCSRIPRSRRRRVLRRRRATHPRTGDRRGVVGVSRCCRNRGRHCATSDCFEGFDCVSPTSHQSLPTTIKQLTQMAGFLGICRLERSRWRSGRWATE